MIMPCRVTDQWDKEPDGTENEQPVSRNRVIEDCDMLLKDIMVNWDYCKQKRDFVPDEDDIDLIEALHGELEFYIIKHYRVAKDALESKKDNN
jgi:hypothetical protein